MRHERFWMNHATDSLLLAYHDGEIDGSALAGLRDHLASCAQCTQELNELRRMSGVLHEALALTDVPAPRVVRPSPAAVPARRLAAWRGVGAKRLGRGGFFLPPVSGVVHPVSG